MFEGLTIYLAYLGWSKDPLLASLPFIVLNALIMVNILFSRGYVNFEFKDQKEVS
jgi:hypothetical protein